MCPALVLPTQAQPGGACSPRPPQRKSSQCLGITLPGLGSPHIHRKSVVPEDGLSWLGRIIFTKIFLSATC